MGPFGSHRFTPAVVIGCGGVVHQPPGAGAGPGEAGRGGGRFGMLLRNALWRGAFGGIIGQLHWGRWTTRVCMVP
jgi:hypothetical protein